MNAPKVPQAALCTECESVAGHMLPHMSWRLPAKRTFGSGPTSISFDGHRSLYHFVKSGGATLSFWEVADCDDDFSAAAAGTCRQVGTRQISDGETVELDGRRQSFVIEHASSDMVYLQAQTTVGAAPLMREHDSATGRFVGASSTDDVASRTGLMLSLLREMDRNDAAPLFVDALAQGGFHARWHAMREFLALDAEAALPHLRAMAEEDPHPEVREAARQTLDAIFAEEEISADGEPQPCPA